jgi:hypothetical protein
VPPDRKTTEIRKSEQKSLILKSDIINPGLIRSRFRVLIEKKNIHEKAKEILDRKVFTSFKYALDGWIQSFDDQVTQNTSFKSLEKYNRDGELTRIIFSEFKPKTGRLYGKAVVITRACFKFVFIGETCCSQP